MRRNDALTRKVWQLFEPFFSLIYPGDANISASQSIEGDYVANYFKGKAWTDLNVDEIMKNYVGDPAACLSFMTDEAFRFFFPGYLKMAVFEYETADAIFDVVLNKIEIASESGHLRSVFERYSRDQLSALAEIIAVLSERYCRFYPVDIAKVSLDKYWGQYRSHHV